MSRRKPSVVVAGATGFVGRQLGPQLTQKYDLIGLTRSQNRPSTHGYRYQRCDLFSLLDAERALRNADFAIYMVHSMMPSASLTQGRFEDMDLICADNFARAAASAGVRHIVYLGGLIPSGALSPHLASRLEVERVLSEHGVPVTSLRAGMVIGAEGSSFEILNRLVRRLPLMACPAWTATPAQPVAVEDVVQLIARSIGRTDLAGAWDIGAPEVMTYREIMLRTAELMGKKRRMIGVPVLSPGLSRLWVSAVTGAPKELVAPLVESLKHPMVARDRQIYERLGVTPTTFDQAVRTAIEAMQHGPRANTPHAFKGVSKGSERRVRSVQRVPLPSGKDATWAAKAYMAWLPKSMRPLISVDIDEARMCRFYARGLSTPLLELRFAPDRSQSDRQLFYVVGGLLCGEPGRGRLEFREVPGQAQLLCALHDFQPSLPWWLYTATQARFHLWVVWSFGRHLAAVGRGDQPDAVAA